MEQLKIDPSSFNVNNNLAFILFDNEDYPAALKHWEQALLTSPGEADACAGKAAALHTLGRDEEALSCYRMAVTSNPEYLDEEMMRNKYLWSEKAIGSVKGFIAELKEKIV